MGKASILSSKNQITLPKEVRRDLGAKSGDLIVFVKAGNGSWSLVRLPKSPLEALKSLGSGLKGKPSEVHEEFESSWEERSA
jgi:AbrB family looped-hinge helix DNA binding protein